MDGLVSNKAQISGTLSAKARISGFINTSSGGEAPTYNGAYEVEAKVRDDTILYTRNKLMTENVLVRKISQHEVANTSGGQTLIIGGD